MNSALIVEDLPEIRSWLGELALVESGSPDGSSLDVVGAVRQHQLRAVPVVVTIYGDAEHLFPALQAGAFGYLMKEQPRATLVTQLLRTTQGEPPLCPPIARRGRAAGCAARPGQPLNRKNSP